MRETGSTGRTTLARGTDVLLGSGHILFSLAIIALGVETFVCGSLVGTLIETNRFGTILGPALVACGVSLLFKRTVRTAAIPRGSLLFIYPLVFDVPNYVAVPARRAPRTQM